MEIVLWVLMGAFAGWIAGQIMKTKHSFIEDIVLGVIGAFVGGYVMNFFGHAGFTGFNFYSLFVAVIGAIVLIALGRILHK